jgi:hypothetical protein
MIMQSEVSPRDGGERRQRVLLVHHNTGSHFEVMLALWSNLKQDHDVWISSDVLHRRGRKSLIERMGMLEHTAETRYDAIIILTAEQPVNPALIGPALRDTATLRLVHRAGHLNMPNSIAVCPFGKPHLIPCSLGLYPTIAQVEPQNRGGFVIQGNIEQRRDYGELGRIAVALPHTTFKVIGSPEKGFDVKSLHSGENVNVLTNLDEFDFYSHCASSKFILPMIDPQNFPQYFRDRFTSSILVGMGLGIPFVAHERLFELYPIAGLSYRNPEDAGTAVRKATELSDSEYSGLCAQLDAKRSAQMRANLDVLNAALKAVQNR